MINKQIKIEKFTKINEEFVSQGFDVYDLIFQQEGRTSFFFIEVNGFKTKIKLDLSNRNYPIRKHIATAINTYKKHLVNFNKINNLSNFNDRDELTQLDLID